MFSDGGTASEWLVHTLPRGEVADLALPYRVKQGRSAKSSCSFVCGMAVNLDRYGKPGS